MNISVFGLGYVGSVTGAALAEDGHTVVGVDVNPDKVASLNAGRSPIVEPGLPELIAKNVAEGRLSATTDTAAAIAGTELSLISVSTPSRRNGSLDLSYLTRVCEQIGEALRDKDGYHIVVVRSTVLPGTTHGTVIPTLERCSGKTYGEGFGVSVNPEFLREGVALHDVRHPPVTVVGHNHAADATGTMALYEGLDAPLVSTSIRVAEMVKYASNTWHAMKICFANEIGNVCKAVGVDSHDVMDIFCQDDKLNISKAYMKPGFAFGGSCLPKDVRALAYRAKELDLELPLIEAVLPSNRRQIQHAIDRIVESGCRAVGMLGLSFKAGTDDLRESPQVQLIKRLLGEGCQLRIWDKDVSLGRLAGSNRQYIEEVIPHIGSLLSTDFEEVVRSGEVVIIGTKSVSKTELAKLLRSGQVVVDLVNLDRSQRPDSPATYQGICW
jgi:GDP-mannose 6-dehydrogenase